MQTPETHLVVGAGPGGHLDSVDHLLDIDHLKDGKGVPDGDPDIAHDREVHIMPCVGCDSSKHTCTEALPDQSLHGQLSSILSESASQHPARACLALLVVRELLIWVHAYLSEAWA